ncbi:hypothetical protein N7539_000643 [Penicillium diatomitis]|uniref:Uncharacterized protein n=1 Tax=Penicillium diatomitis TaxID=2819901 RepID=A0A9W9XM24_9EURO|nr:uncharacterized protein N7539_000643 [Penicillium diatomitis]KAJ5495527.1 hypothetical protein N7539_000643 [Penicillium diatomitis]
MTRVSRTISTLPWWKARTGDQELPWTRFTSFVRQSILGWESHDYWPAGDSTTLPNSIITFRSTKNKTKQTAGNLTRSAAQSTFEPRSVIGLSTGIIAQRLSESKSRCIPSQRLTILKSTSFANVKGAQGPVASNSHPITARTQPVIVIRLRIRPFQHPIGMTLGLSYFNVGLRHVALHEAVMTG